jgi:hypothetical protein
MVLGCSSVLNAGGGGSSNMRFVKAIRNQSLGIVRLVFWASFLVFLGVIHLLWWPSAEKEASKKGECQVLM